MKNQQLLLLLGVCAAGLGTGYAGKRLAGGSPAPESAQAAPGKTGKPGSGPAADDPGGARSAPAPIPGLRSDDTLDSIKTAEGPGTYARVALWMAGANEEELAAYWEHYRQQKSRSNDINDLIFINWTRINPQGATAAAKGTPDEHYAWWAWACHDPGTALAEAIANNPDRVNNVTWGIGEFHPEWLREHFDELPEGSRNNAFQGMQKWDDISNPLEMLDFIKEKGQGFDVGIFKVLAHRDPWAAYDWLQANGSSDRIYSAYGENSDAMGIFIATVSEQDPEVLKRIADQAPSGQLKRRMESALFEKLLAEDPEAAVAQAKETKAPYVAAEQLAKAGLSFVRTDPDRAFELAEALFAACPNPLNLSTRIDYGNGSSSSFGSGNPDAQSLVGALLVKDPERLMGMNLAPLDGTHFYQSSLYQLSSMWVEQDIDAYTGWVVKQTDPKIREPLTTVAINKLSSVQNFAEAADLALGLDGSRDIYLSNIVPQWLRNSPTEAITWLESSGLPEETVEKLQESIRNNPNQ